MRKGPTRRGGELMETERLFGMFDAVAGILATIMLATSNLAFIEFESVCESVKASSCPGYTTIVSPLNGWTPWAFVGGSGLDFFHTSQSCFEKDYNATSFCEMNEDAKTPDAFFVAHHLPRINLFFTAFTAAHMFWTKHAVATRAVERAPTLGLMVVHSILVLAMGLFITMVSVTGAVGTKRMNDSLLVSTSASSLHADEMDLYEYLFVFLEAIAPTLYCLALWTLAVANLDFWAVVWRSKPSKIMVPPPKRDHGLSGCTCFCHCPHVWGTPPLNHFWALVCHPLLCKDWRLEGYGLGHVGTVNTDCRGAVQALEEEEEELDLEIPGTWVALAVIRCTEALFKAVCFIFLGVFCKYVRIVDKLPMLVLNSIVAPTVLFVMFGIFVRLVMDSDGDGVKAPLFGDAPLCWWPCVSAFPFFTRRAPSLPFSLHSISYYIHIIFRCCTRIVLSKWLCTDPKWRTAYLLDRAEQRVISRARLHVFTDGIFAIAATLVLLEMKVEEKTDSLQDFVAAQGPKVICSVLVWFTLWAIWGLHRRTFRAPRHRVVRHSEGSSSGIEAGHSSDDNEGDSSEGDAEGEGEESTVSVNAARWSNSAMFFVALCPLAFSYAHYFPVDRKATFLPFLAISCAVRSLLTSAVVLAPPARSTAADAEAEAGVDAQTEVEADADAERDGAIPPPQRRFAPNALNPWHAENRCGKWVEGRCFWAPYGMVLECSKRCCAKHCNVRSEAVWVSAIVYAFTVVTLAHPHVELLWLMVGGIALTLFIQTDIVLGFNLCAALCARAQRGDAACARPSSLSARTSSLQVERGSGAYGALAE